LAAPHDALAQWHDFYVLIGTAAGTLVGLLFVAATIRAGVFSGDRQAPRRVFLSASVVHFAGVLVASLIVLVPTASWILLGVMVLACGLTGLAYYGLALRDAARDGLLANMDMEDRIWYAALPVIAYLAETVAAIMLISAFEPGCAVLAASMGMLLVVGIHNAWDITVWTITRRQE
jgi:hypothetical protein